MTVKEYDDLRITRQVIVACVSNLRLTRCTDEDVTVAKARLENWLAENDGRWVA
jgi:hypothetical protein